MKQLKKKINELEEKARTRGKLQGEMRNADFGRM
jgi:hypothetical protein